MFEARIFSEKPFEHFAQTLTNQNFCEKSKYKTANLHFTVPYKSSKNCNFYFNVLLICFYAEFPTVKIMSNSSLKLDPGSNSTISCNGSGIPAPTICWFKRNGNGNQGRASDRILKCKNGTSRKHQLNYTFNDVKFLNKK